MLLNQVSLRQAGASDWPAVQALLLANKLPTEGAQAHLSTYVLAVLNGEVVGCAGAEVYGAVALLRSVAVAPDLRKQGVGRLLLQTMLDQARARDIASLHLLTVTAPEYFARYGFRRAELEAAPAALKVSAEFQGACPACAAFMSLTLREAPEAEAGLPVAVLGAGPVGLAAAAQLIEHGLHFVMLEAGNSVGANLLDYGHVRLFSPWKYNVDVAMARLLAPTGWTAPPQTGLPQARDIVERVMQPFAALPQVARSLKLGARVVAISREGFDKVKTIGRDKAAFIVRYVQDWREHEVRARAVIDATGTWSTPNPIGANGLPAIGEAAAGGQVFYGIPDVTGLQRDRYAGKRTLVVGAGHSAANALLYLADLARQAPGTRLAWAVRSTSPKRVFGGGSADALPARGELGRALQRLRDSSEMEFFSGLRIAEVRREPSGQLTVLGIGAHRQQMAVTGIDEIICATGQRPDLSMSSELRLKLDPWLESTEALGPLIDPNLHSCGTVRPHGHRELAQPEPGFYTVGAKSYGRAPTFLMATGFEQARSVVAALAGDLDAADRVELNLPETGVCSIGPGDADAGRSSCCGTPAQLPQAAKHAAPAVASKPAGSSCCGPKPAPATLSSVAAKCCG
ncbi:MAG: GNAT family N-acetyltransferase [Rubrivivax sp.]|nr:MAG: GNAT family N-acetyltransferase [Rubrivivax sp.]